MFNGKIGIWPFVEDYVAARNSTNRPKGTVLKRNIASVNRIESRRMMIDHVIPAIKSQWPRGEKHKVIYVQQDNCKVHVPADDPEVLAAGTSDGWKIIMRNQPPNSPDFNVLDLGYFKSIQTLQYEENISNIDQLLAAVENSFDKLSYTKLNDVFLTLQKVFECVMQCGGGNDYALPHIGKQKLRNCGALPLALECDSDIYEQTINLAKSDTCI